MKFDTGRSEENCTNDDQVYVCL